MSEPVVIASGLYCPEDGGELQAFAALVDQPGSYRRIPVLKLMCRECDWRGRVAEAIER